MNSTVSNTVASGWKDISVPVFIRVAYYFKGLLRNAAVIYLSVTVTVLADFGNESICKRVYAGYAHAVQSGRNFIAAVLVAAAEFAARVEVGERKLYAADALLLVYAGGYAPAVILYDAAAVRK